MLMVKRLPIALVQCVNTLPQARGVQHTFLGVGYRCTQMVSDLQANGLSKHGCRLHWMHKNKVFLDYGRIGWGQTRAETGTSQ